MYILRHGLQHRDRILFGLAVQSMVSTIATIFPEPQFFWSCSFILGCRIVPPFTLRTGQSYDNTHALSRLFINPNSLICYSITSLMTPAPTVRPPSRMAKRNSFSIAIGVINSTDTDTLSPGITISTPSGNVTTPVTSVVRK